VPAPFGAVYATAFLFFSLLVGGILIVLSSTRLTDAGEILTAIGLGMMAPFLVGAFVYYTFPWLALLGAVFFAIFYLYPTGKGKGGRGDSKGSRIADAEALNALSAEALRKTILSSLESGAYKPPAAESVNDIGYTAVIVLRKIDGEWKMLFRIAEKTPEEDKRKNPSSGKTFSFPAGDIKKKEREDLRKSVQRELREEVGLEIELDSLIGTVGDYQDKKERKIRLFVYIDTTETAPKGEGKDEKADFLWVSVGSFLSLRGEEAGEAVLETLRDGILKLRPDAGIAREDYRMRPSLMKEGIGGFFELMSTALTPSTGAKLVQDQAATLRQSWTVDGFLAQASELSRQESPDRTLIQWFLEKAADAAQKGGAPFEPAQSFVNKGLFARFVSETGLSGAKDYARLYAVAEAIADVHSRVSSQVIYDVLSLARTDAAFEGAPVSEGVEAIRALAVWIKANYGLQSKFYSRPDILKAFETTLAQRGAAEFLPSAGARVATVDYFERRSAEWKPVIERLRYFVNEGLIYAYGVSGGFSRGSSEPRDLDLVLLLRPGHFSTEVSNFVDEVNAKQGFVHLTLEAFGPSYRYDPAKGVLIDEEFVRNDGLVSAMKAAGTWNDANKVIYWKNTDDTQSRFWANLHEVILASGARLIKKADTAAPWLSLLENEDGQLRELTPDDWIHLFRLLFRNKDVTAANLSDAGQLVFAKVMTYPAPTPAAMERILTRLASVWKENGLTEKVGVLEFLLSKASTTTVSPRNLRRTRFLMNRSKALPNLLAYHVIRHAFHLNAETPHSGMVSGTARYIDNEHLLSHLSELIKRFASMDEAELSSPVLAGYDNTGAPIRLTVRTLHLWAIAVALDPYVYPSAKNDDEYGRFNEETHGWLTRARVVENLLGQSIPADVLLGVLRQVAGKDFSEEGLVEPYNLPPMREFAPSLMKADSGKRKGHAIEYYDHLQLDIEILEAGSRLTPQQEFEGFFGSQSADVMAFITGSAELSAVRGYSQGEVVDAERAHDVRRHVLDVEISGKTERFVFYSRKKGHPRAVRESYILEQASEHGLGPEGKLFLYDSAPMLVIKELKGRSLEGVELTVEMAEGIAYALGRLHALGVVHDDLWTDDQLARKHIFQKEDGSFAFIDFESGGYVGGRSPASKELSAVEEAQHVLNALQNEMNTTHDAALNEKISQDWTRGYQRGFGEAKPMDILVGKLNSWTDSLSSFGIILPALQKNPLAQADWLLIRAYEKALKAFTRFSDEAKVEVLDALERLEDREGGIDLARVRQETGIDLVILQHLMDADPEFKEAVQKAMGSRTAAGSNEMKNALSSAVGFLREFDGAAASLEERMKQRVGKDERADFAGLHDDWTRNIVWLYGFDVEPLRQIEESLGGVNSKKAAADELRGRLAKVRQVLAEMTEGTEQFVPTGERQSLVPATETLDVMAGPQIWLSSNSTISWQAGEFGEVEAELRIKDESDIHLLIEVVLTDRWKQDHPSAMRELEALEADANTVGAGRTGRPGVLGQFVLRWGVTSSGKTYAVIEEVQTGTGLRSAEKSTSRRNAVHKMGRWKTATVKRIAEMAGEKNVLLFGAVFPIAKASNGLSLSEDELRAHYVKPFSGLDWSRQTILLDGLIRKLWVYKNNDAFLEGERMGWDSIKEMVAFSSAGSRVVSVPFDLVGGAAEARSLDFARQLIHQLDSKPDKVGFYPAMGGDVATALALMGDDMRTLVTIDLLKFYADPSGVPPSNRLKAAIEKYASSKKRIGRTGGDELKEINNIYPFIRWELEMLGATDIRVEETPAGHAVHFDWGGHPRTIHYVKGLADVNNLEKALSALNISELDFFILKSGEFLNNVRSWYDLTKHVVDNRLRRGGIMVASKHSKVVFESGLEEHPIQADPEGAFWKDDLIVQKVSGARLVVRAPVPAVDWEGFPSQARLVQADFSAADRDILARFAHAKGTRLSFNPAFHMAFEGGVATVVPIGGFAVGIDAIVPGGQGARMRVVDLGISDGADIAAAGNLAERMEIEDYKARSRAVAQAYERLVNEDAFTAQYHADRTVEFRLVTQEVLSAERRAALEGWVQAVQSRLGGTILIRFGSGQSDFKPLPGSGNKDAYAVVYMGEMSEALLSMAEGHGIAATPAGTDREDAQPAFIGQMVFSVLVQRLDSPVESLQLMWANLRERPEDLDPANFGLLRKVAPGSSLTQYENLTFRVYKIAWETALASAHIALQAFGQSA